MKKILICLGLFSICLAGCHTIKQNSKEVLIQRDTIKEKQFVHDSIYVYKMDSILITRKNDTVFLEKYHNIYKYIDRLKTDTLIKANIIYKTKEVYVEKVPKRNIFQSLINILAGLILLYIIFRIIKWKFRF